MSTALYPLVPPFVAVVILLARLLMDFGYKLGLVDEPNERYSHTKIIPRVGGLAIFLPYLVLGTGFYITGYNVDNLYGLFGLGAIPSWLGIGLSIITVVYLINAVNLIDGVDGLAAGISLLALYLFSALMGGGEHLITFAFIGLGLIVFMGFNYSDKRKIFLGDAGSLSLGFILATFAMEFLHSGNNHIAHLNLNPVIVAVLVLGYPVADTIRVFAIRISLGLSPFNADRRHMHHVLLDKGFSHFGTTTFIMTVMAGLVLGNKFLASRLDSHLMILLNILGILLIHLFVRHRSTQLRIFWRSFSRTVFNPVKKVWNKFVAD